MHEYKLQEKLTTKKIEYDLKRQYNRESLISCIMLSIILAACVTVVLFIKNEPPVKHEGASLYFLIALLIIAALLCLVLLFICIRPIYMRLIGYKRYKIGIDSFMGLCSRRIWWAKRRHRIQYFFKFARYGGWHLDFEQWYYTWSEHYKTYGYDLDDSFRVDERFFVILIGKKIRYVYNDKMFDLSETLKKEKLIDCYSPESE